MNRKMSKRQKDIKSKLMAAICMLLVSSIMMVSTTYAWFTLSTAPEVTGISTAVGANGNLEMALLNPELQETNKSLLGNWADEIDSETNSSMEAAGQTKHQANITWGNLVDLKDNKTYGLNNINLYPAKLNVVAAAATPDNDDTQNDGGTDTNGNNPENASTPETAAETGTTTTTSKNLAGKTIGDRPLQRPVFGSDGRIAELKADTITASLLSGTFSNEDALGVRAVGTASEMTARQLAHRTAMSAAATATSEAKAAASGALFDEGDVLASMAIKKATSSEADPSFTRAEVESLQTVVNALVAAHNKIETAMRQYTIAHNLGDATVTDDQVAGIVSAIEGAAWATLATDDTYAKPTDFAGAYAKLQESRGKVAPAKTTLDDLLNDTSATTFTWKQFSSALTTIMDVDQMTLCGVGIKQLMEKNTDGSYKNLDKVDISNLTLEMPSGSGVLADIADFCGEYSAGITFPAGTTVSGLPIGGQKATMITNNPRTPTWLGEMRSNTTQYTAGSEGNTTVSITDFYGYIIDLGFRTNAANSNLLLQTKGVDRIYDGNTANDETLGAGSTMTFRSSVLGRNEVIELMQNLRVIFFETGTKVILGEARLDPSTQSSPEANGGTTGTTGSAGDAGSAGDGTTTVAEGEGTESSEPTTGTTATESTESTESTEPTTGGTTGTTGGAATSSEVTMELYMWDADANTRRADSVITALTQNTGKAVSVLVYLDGERVTNKNVAATGGQSMTGSMNLQFASSAELTPMDYADLKNGKADTDGSNAPITLNNVKVAPTTAAEGYAVESAKSGTYNTVSGFAVSLSKDVPTGDTVTATVGGSTLTGVPAPVNGVSGYVFSYSGTLAADTEIVITVTKANQIATYTVTLPSSYPEGVSCTAGAASVTSGNDYTLTLKNTTESEYTVAYTPEGESAVTMGTLSAKGADAESDVEETFTIDADVIKKNFTITVTVVQ